MPKILITENVIVNFGDDRGGIDTAQGDIVETSKDVAAKLVGANRALYIDKRDDPSKAKHNTATGEIIKAAKEAAAAKAAAAKAAEKAPAA